jgi:D-amino peptidase
MSPKVNHFRALLVILGGGVACGGPAEQTVAVEPWSIEDYVPTPEDGIRVLVLHDMEGLSGQSDPRTFNFGRPQYSRGQEMLAADINAVVDGLFAGGATEVHVVDGHGSGNPNPDVRRDLLDERAQQVLRDEAFDTYFDVPETSTYDAVAVVGMHAKTGSGGFASHTYTLGIEFRINGQAITETELVALSWGRFGVPVIFGSGDDRLAADLETMPWIQFVTVKQATAADSATTRPVEEARADLRAGAQRAVEQLASARVMRVTTPISATMRAVPPADLSILEGVPGIEYASNAVRFQAEDLRAAYDGLTALVGVATRAYPSVLFEQLRAHASGTEISARYRDALAQRWFDVESGRWTAPSPAAPTSSTSGQFHGYR